MGISDGELTSIAMCWRMERGDGAGLALTSHDRAIMSDAVMHDPTPGMVPAAVKRNIGIEPHSAEIAGALSSDSLSEQDLGLGRWDGARVSLSAVDWRDLAAIPIRLIVGELGTTSINGESFS